MYGKVSVECNKSNKFDTSDFNLLVYNTVYLDKLLKMLNMNGNDNIY